MPDIMNRSQASLILAVLLAAMLSKDIDAAGDAQTFTLRIHEHLFDPDVIVLPQHKLIKLIVDNQDADAEEIFSSSLNIKKIIPGKSQGFVIIRPLEAGDYPLQGHFFPRTAVGIIRVIN